MRNGGGGGDGDGDSVAAPNGFTPNTQQQHGTQFSRFESARVTRVTELAAKAFITDCIRAYGR